MPRSRFRASLPFLVALLLVAPLLCGGAAADDATEIAVLLRDRTGRDADLEPRPLEPVELDRLEHAAATSLVLGAVQPNGAQVLVLPGAVGDGPLRRILAGLRALPEVVYADDLPRPDGTGERPVPSTGDIDRLVVKLRDQSSRDDSDAARPLSQEVLRRLSRVAGVPLYYERTVSGGAYALRLFQRMPPASVAAIAVRLEADPDVAYAEPTVRGRFGIPDDPLFEAQWPLYAPGGGIRAPEAWDRSVGDPRVVIAVLDSGVLPAHPDLRDRLLPGHDFVSDVRRSNDLDGRDADPTDPGDATMASECASGSAATRSTWHGTHVAGTIGASTNNGLGVAGVDWQARILPVRVGAKCGIDPIDLVDAIRWAAGAVAPGARIPDAPPNPHPARVLNLSMEFPGACPRSLQDAISDATAAGALVVVAAGNLGRAAQDFYPANCQGVVAVHANDRDGGRAPYSNYGRVDVSAPGGTMVRAPSDGVLSTSQAGDRDVGAYEYAFKEGTSMAAPIVSGVAALVLSLDESLRPGEVQNVLIATARPFSAGTGSDCSADGALSCGAGIVDAAAALSSVR
jgi:serine protease